MPKPVRPLRPAPAPVELPDFRTEPARLTWHNGRRYWIQVCHELIDGRWEGFVAMHPAEAA